MKQYDTVSYCKDHRREPAVDAPPTRSPAVDPGIEPATFVTDPVASTTVLAFAPAASTRRCAWSKASCLPYTPTSSESRAESRRSAAETRRRKW